MKFGIQGQLTDVIMCVKFLVDRFRGYGVLIPQKLPFPIDLLRRPYNSVALPCDTVIHDIWQKNTIINLKQNVLLVTTPGACCYTTLSIFYAFQ